jgi:hypothetical protein
MPEADASLREFVRSRAGGRCEYCRISERFTLAEHQLDHVVAMKHGGRTVAGNLALACALCNRFKGSDIASIDPQTGELTPLFHPRIDIWEDHYEFRDGEIFGLTVWGRATVFLLRMNRPARVRERQILRG